MVSVVTRLGHYNWYQSTFRDNTLARTRAAEMAERVTDNCKEQADLEVKIDAKMEARMQIMLDEFNE